MCATTRSTRRNAGFTLVELIIVIAIIAVLSAVAAPQYIKYVDKSRWSTDQDNAQILLSSVQAAVVGLNSDAVPTNDVSVTTNGTVIMTFTKDGADLAATGSGSAFTAGGLDGELKEIMGADYADTAVTNNGAAAGDEDHETFEIKMDTNGAVTGAWNDGTGGEET